VGLQQLENEIYRGQEDPSASATSAAAGHYVWLVKGGIGVVAVVVVGECRGELGVVR